MSIVALVAWVKANEALIATVLFAISELLGSNPNVKANGILSFVLIQIQTRLKEKGAKDLTP
jgi:hypothetical protein